MTRHEPGKRANRPQPVHAVKHNDKRANIPTQELRDFVADDDGRWAFLEITDPWDAKNTIRAMMRTK